MRYLLMNKNKRITDFEVDTDYSCVYMVHGTQKCKRAELPYGYKLKEEDSDIDKGLSDWLTNRNAAIHNRLSDMFTREMGLYNHESFIRTTHATSLNDSFWVKAEDESLKWEDVSLYDKDYNDLVGKASLGVIEAIHEIENRGKIVPRPEYMPELLHRGSFPRMFKQTENGILFYKADGSAENAYSEMMASEISEVISGKYHVPYSCETLYGKRVSCCKVFTDEETGIVTPYMLTNAAFPSIEKLLELAERFNCGDAYRRMLVFDAVIFNTDRHLNNFGFLVDNESLEVKGFAPFYDQNLCLFGNLSKDDFDHPDRHVYYRSPRFYRDFTELGQKMITEDIASDVEKLKDFSFKFRGDEHFSEWKVEGTERIIRMQAKALLDKTLTSETAFIIGKTDEEKLKEKYDKAVFRANTVLRIAFSNTSYKAELITDQEKSRVLIEASDNENTGTMTIDMMTLNFVQSGKQFDTEFTNRVSGLLDTFSRQKAS